MLNVKTVIYGILLIVMIFGVNFTDSFRSTTRLLSKTSSATTKGISVKVNPETSRLQLTKIVQRSFSSETINETLLFIAGEIHYFRIHYQLWGERLQKMKLGGINVVTIPIEWATHEPQNGKYNFVNSGDIGQFLSEVQSLEMMAILKIGPYIGADRELGGLPAWLLFEQSVPNNETWLRTNHPIFRRYYERWFAKLFDQIESYKFDNGGPIIGFQIEQEYGQLLSPCDKSYLENIAALVENFSEVVFLYTEDKNQRDSLRCSRTALKNVYPVIKLETAKSWFDEWEEAKSNYHQITTLRSPFMVSFGNLPPQYSAVSWNRRSKLTTCNCNEINRLIRELIKEGVCVNYLYAGGTNFGLTGGKCNTSTLGTIPSYGHYAPLTPAGYPTDQYFKIRQIIRDLMPNSSPFTKDQPQINIVPEIVYPSVQLEPFNHLLSEVSKALLASEPVFSVTPKSFRQLQLQSGYILYATKLKFNPSSQNLDLTCKGVLDRGYVYFKHRFVGTLDARNTKVTLKNVMFQDTIQILVENNGRISNGFQFGNDTKGIHTNVYLGNHKLSNWTAYPFDFDEETIETLFTYATFALPDPRIFRGGPILFRGVFFSSVQHAYPIDSYLNMQAWGKGIVLLNNHIVGRYWSTLGPQLTLYVPGEFINPFPLENVIIVLELEHIPNNGIYQLSFVHTPIFRD